MKKSQIREKLGREVDVPEVEKGKISVIIPIYRTFDPTRVLMTIDSLKMQKGIDLEIVVAEQSDNPLFGNILGITYTQVPNAGLIEGKHFVPGKVRNIAARASTGEFLYNNDGDILFHNEYLLSEAAELIKENPIKALYRPPMRRLPIECFEDFKKMWSKDGLKQTLEQIDISEEYIAKTPGATVGMRVFKKHESRRDKVFLYTTTDHERYKNEPNRQGQEPRFSTLNVHGGGTLMRREYFYLIGGYCEGYSAWGCHDADIQWKLKSVLDLQQFPYENRFEVLHLDHERAYFDKKRWESNKALQKSRKEKGVLEAIKEDLENA